MTYQNAVISLLTIAILSIAVHEMRSQIRTSQEMAMMARVREPTEVRVIRVDRASLAEILLTDAGAAREMLGLESQAIDLERGRVLDVGRRLQPVASGRVDELILPVRSRGRPLSLVVIASEE